jgi:hypothetical protein
MANPICLFNMITMPTIPTCSGHAMPIGLRQRYLDRGILNRTSAPIFVFADGRIVPISRGSPPFYD